MTLMLNTSLASKNRSDRTSGGCHVLKPPVEQLLQICRAGQSAAKL